MLKNEIFNIDSADDFMHLAIEVFRFQYDNVQVYRNFCDLLRCNPSKVKTIEEIPFLPIQFFKSLTIIAEGMKPEITFTSSGTTGMSTSNHLVGDLKIYEKSFNEGFLREYGHPNDYAILALLPSYLEREGSSLIYMVESLIKNSNNPHSGFYLDEMDSLIRKLDFLERKGQKSILLGVSYALLDLIEMKSFKLKHTVIMEKWFWSGKNS